MNPSDCYNTHWPIVRGQLNMHTGPGGSLSATLADLETIWGHIIQKQLDIPLKDLKVGGDTSFINMDKKQKRNILTLCFTFSLPSSITGASCWSLTFTTGSTLKRSSTCYCSIWASRVLLCKKCVNIHVPFSVEWLIHVSFLSSHSLVCA